MLRILSIRKGDNQIKTKLTYNNGFGRVNANEYESIVYVKRDACVRAWQKITEPSAGFGGGSASVIFDTNKEVIDETGRKYNNKKSRKE